MLRPCVFRRATSKVGSAPALHELDRFLDERVLRYRRGMSSPLSAGDDCSRLSPHLARVPLELLAEPWRMTPDEQMRAGCVIGRDYPAPVVEHLAAARAARDAVWAVRRLPPAGGRCRSTSRVRAARQPQSRPRRCEAPSQGGGR